MSVCSPQEFLRTPCLPELYLVVRIADAESATPAALGRFVVGDAVSPLPANLAARTTKEVLDKLVDGDAMPTDLRSQFEAAVRLGPAVPDDRQLRRPTEQHRQTCDTLQATEDALRSARQDLVHQRKMHDGATERLPSRNDDLQVQVTKLVETLDRNHCHGRRGHGRHGNPASCEDLALSRSQAHRFPMLCSQLWRNSALPTIHGLTSIMRHGIRPCRFF